MRLALMKHRDQILAKQTFRSPSPSPAIGLNGLIQTMTTQAQKMGARLGATKYPCNRSHQILWSCSYSNTHAERGVSFLHIYWDIQLLFKTTFLVWKKIPF